MCGNVLVSNDSDCAIVIGLFASMRGVLCTLCCILSLSVLGDGHKTTPTSASLTGQIKHLAQMMNSVKTFGAVYKVMGHLEW